MGSTRLATVCGGFVDIPLQALEAYPIRSKASVSFSRFSQNSEEDCILMNGILLAKRDEHLVYSCGGLILKIFDTRGGATEEIIVSMGEERTLI